MAAVPRVRDAAGVIAALAVDEPRLRAAREAVDRRAIAYPFGSGHAEEIALLDGRKPMVRQSLRREQLDAARARFQAMGLAVVESDSPRGGAERLLFVGRDAAALRAAAAAERAKDAATVGRLLGYPACCSDAFAATPPLVRRNARLFQAALARTDGPPRARLNVLDLGVFHYLPWIPCAFSCEPSIRFADAVARRIVAGHAAGCVHHRFLARVDEALAAARLLVLEEVQVSIPGLAPDGALAPGAARPTAQDRHPGAPLDPAAREAAARLLATVAGARRIAVEDGTLSVDDRPLLASDALLLARFTA